MAHGHVTTCSTSLVVRDMQSKTVTRYHFPPTSMAFIKNQPTKRTRNQAQSTEIISVDKGTETLEHLGTAGRNLKWCTAVEKCWQGVKK